MKLHESEVDVLPLRAVEVCLGEVLIAKQYAS